MDCFASCECTHSRDARNDAVEADTPMAQIQKKFLRSFFLKSDRLLLDLTHIPNRAAGRVGGHGGVSAQGW
jgi:hypothetical protein